MKLILKAKAIVLLVLLLAFNPDSVQACHLAGGDMYVNYTGAGIDGCTGTTEYKYDVFLTMYTACQTCGLGIGAAVNGQVSSATLGGAPIALNFVDVKGPTADEDTVHSLCPQYNDSNSCKNIDPYHALRYPGFRRRVYLAQVTLPSAQTDWIFSYSIGARSGNANMPSCAFGQLYIEVLLNNLTKYNNSTPRFTTNPLPYICVNQPSTYLNGPVDPDNDSIYVYQNAPHTGFNTPCAFSPTFPLTDPMGSAASNPYKLNPTTGAATFTPVNTGNYLLGFRAEDYERGTGIKLSHVYRDIQVSVLPCNEAPPGIDSLNTSVTVASGSVVPVIGGSKAVVTCPGNNLNFTLNSKAGDASHTVYMNANTALIPGSTFTVTGAGTQSVSGSFQWTPTAGDVGEHTLIITSSDSTCNASQPIVLRSYTVVYIKVITGLDAGNDLATCALNPPGRQLTVKGYGNLQLNFKWTDISGGPAQDLSADNIPNPISYGKANTQYVVFSPDLKDNCKVRDTVLVYVDTSNTMDIFPQQNPFVLCRPDYLQLDAVVKGRGPIANMVCGIGNPSDNPDVDSLMIYGTPAYGIGFSYDTLGTAAPVLPNQVKSTRYQYLIRKEELKEFGMRPSTIKRLAFETAKNQTPTLDYANFTISMMCTNKTELSKVTGFEKGATVVYKAPGLIQFPDGVQDFTFDSPYSWDTSKNLIVELCFSDNPAVAAPCTPTTGLPGLIKYMPTTYVGGLELRAPDAVTKTVCDVNNSVDIKEFVTRPVFKFVFNEAPGLSFNYAWSPGTFLSDSTSKQPLAYVPKTVDYTVQTFGRNGCILRDSIRIYMPTHDFQVWPKDTSICFGETAPLEIRNGTYFEWFKYEDGQYKSAHESLSCDYCANPIAKPLKSTHYKIKVGDEVFCYDTIDAYIEVRPLPNVNILNRDTVIKYGQSIQLLVNGARVYNWTPVSSISNPNISYPIATPTESTMYVVSGIGSNGCRANDTVRVGINYRDNLFIPTAFSPNGDGKNDVFKVSNMTFQRFVEFRVFNRWGQEVFNGGAGDGKTGWDGMWKGVAQEVGNYQYLIKVGYPDGLVETYKGDVNLIR